MPHNNGSQALDRQECLRLLAKAPVGRIVYTRQALPAVLPVNFSLDPSLGLSPDTDSCVLLRTSADSDLARSVDGVVVAFEADEFDADAESGWSVVVTGRAAVVTDPAEHERLLQTGPRSWVTAQDAVFVRISCEMVTGRRIGQATDLR
jgi:nitroimidazol reductase NimA-like FMN-containing flavoprotein (pyridoxamine 5'-phosphate oxidase superfamily)